MKTALLACCCLACLASGRAADLAEPTAEVTRLPREQIEILVGPIALYPDTLVALILPASTRPSDIVLAARYLERGENPDRIDAQDWEESIRALARYPDVIRYLDTNLAWTRRLGDCFLLQPAEVMEAIQAVRAQARRRGLLTDSEQQSVLIEDDEIRIVPAQSTVIYVPRYDPACLYVSDGWYGGPFLTFGIGYSIGTWLSYECDWRIHRVRVVPRAADWTHRPDWRARPDYRHDRPDRRGREWTYSHPRPTDRGQFHPQNRPVARPNYADSGRPDAPRPDSPRSRPRVVNRDNPALNPQNPANRPANNPHRPSNRPAPSFTPPAPVPAVAPTTNNVALSSPVTPATPAPRPRNDNHNGDRSAPRWQPRNDHEGRNPGTREVRATPPPAPRHTEVAERSNNHDAQRGTDKNSRDKYRTNDLD